MVDIASRVYNHKWKIDPIVRSTKTIRLAEIVDEGELREQLDHVRSLSLSRGESTFLRGNTSLRANGRRSCCGKFPRWRS